MSSYQTVVWDAVRRQLESVERSLEEFGQLPPDAEARLLQERAQLLAREPEPTAAASEWLQVLEFALGQDRYAFELDAVCEVTRFHEVTPVPCTPPFVLGIINLRGEILTVIHLTRLFGLSAENIPDGRRIIVVESGGMQLGIAVDAIVGVRMLRVSELQTGLATLTGIPAEQVHGITNDRLVVLHGGKVLSDSRLVIQDQVES
jgi:purine-binding chemotaxis protein CheW